MSDKSSQSPRALRDSTNDPEEFSKGDVQLGMTGPSKRDPVNEHAWEIQDDPDYKNLYL